MAWPPAPSAPPAKAPSTGPLYDRSKELVTVSAAFMISIVAVVAVRFWVRVKMVGKTGLDDWFICVATVLSSIWCVSAIISTQHGTGKYMMGVPPSDFPIAVKYLFISEPLSVLIVCLIKVSIALFLHRLAATKTYRYTCLGFVMLISLYSFASFCFMILKCTPISFNWDSTVSGGWCVSPETWQAMAESYSIICVLSDFFLVLLPIAMLWGVKIPRLQRCMICAVMGVGTFAATASIVKATYIRGTFNTSDPLWDVIDIVIWTAIENNVGIISASMPALKPLITKVVEKTMSSITGEGSSGTRASQAHGLSAIRIEGGTQRGSKCRITNDIRANRNRGAANMANGSEEEIIGISRTTDVRVDVETVSNSSGGIQPAGAELHW